MSLLKNAWNWLAEVPTNTFIWPLWVIGRYVLYCSVCAGFAFLFLWLATLAS